MSKALRKLTLSRETLLPLHDSDLTAINGGTSPVISAATRVTFRVSIRACQAVSAFTVRQAETSFTGIKKSVQTAKKVSGALLRPPAHTPTFELSRFGPGVSR
jgi:hypothetical protein